MKVTAIKTRVVEVNSLNLRAFLEESLKDIPEKSVIAITSKVVALCEGSAVPTEETEKDELIERESEYFLPRLKNKYSVYLTIRNNMLVPSAGVDESNAKGCYITWPQNPQASANMAWDFLRQRFGLKELGVIITDSVSSPLRWGVTGRCVSYCGFKGIFPRIGEPDLFGRKLKMTRVNIADALAASAVLCMGESNEQTPIAIIEDVPFTEFTQQYPTEKELKSMRITFEDDLYGQLLTSVKWRKGGKSSERD